MGSWRDAEDMAERIKMKWFRQFVTRSFQEEHQVHYEEIYDRFASYTLIPEDSFCDNLALIHERSRALRGAFVECGTWKGGMAAAMMQIGGPGRKYHFYDSFEGLPPAATIDGPDAVAWQSDADDPFYLDNLRADYDEFLSLIRSLGDHADHVSVEKGWFDDTVPNYCGDPIAVLRIDGDWYRSTKLCLDVMFQHVEVDGVVILDDYDFWDGCSRAVHDFLAETGSTARIRRTGDSSTAFLHKIDP